MYELDPALFDAMVAVRGREWDVARYLEVAGSVAGPVLELGAGTARILQPLLAAGVDAYGIELDPGMLAAGRARIARQCEPEAAERLLLGDMSDFSHPRAYAMVLLPYNLLSLLPGADALGRALDCIEACLQPGGEIAFDILLTESLNDTSDSYSWEEQPKALDAAGVPISFHEGGTFTPATRLYDIRYEFHYPDGRVVLQQLNLFQWLRPELEALLAARGWRHRHPPLNEQGQPFQEQFGFYLARMRRELP